MKKWPGEIRLVSRLAASLAARTKCRTVKCKIPLFRSSNTLMNKSTALTPAHICFRRTSLATSWESATQRILLCPSLSERTCSIVSGLQERLYASSTLDFHLQLISPTSALGMPLPQLVTSTSVTPLSPTTSLLSMQTAVVSAAGQKKKVVLASLGRISTMLHLKRLQEPICTPYLSQLPCHRVSVLTLTW